MSGFFTLVLSLTLVLYPLGVYFGLKYFEPRYIGLLLLAVFCIRLLTMKIHLNGVQIQQFLPVFVVVVLTSALVTFSNEGIFLRLNPSFINAALLGLFLYTLWRPPSIIERIARLTHPDLPESGVLYTRAVTWVWCGFFVINGSIALYTALYSSLEHWTIYNGLISYMLMGILFAVEFAVRQVKMRENRGAKSQ